MLGSNGEEGGVSCKFRFSQSDRVSNDGVLEPVDEEGNGERLPVREPLTGVKIAGRSMVDDVAVNRPKRS
jgi:hypothetical protein